MIMSFSEYLTESKKEGSFIGVKLSNKSNEEIMSLIRKLNLPSSVKKEDIHITLIYSKKYFANKEWDKKIEEVATPIKLDWLGEKNDCLVLLLDSNYLFKRNKEITKEYGATSDYDKYSPHITLAYNIKDYNIPNKVKLPKQVELVSEYYNELEKDWADNK
jgi:2'-5' RNA ligase